MSPRLLLPQCPGRSWRFLGVGALAVPPTAALPKEKWAGGLTKPKPSSFAPTVLLLVGLLL